MTEHDLRKFPDEPNTRPDVPSVRPAGRDTGLLNWASVFCDVHAIKLIWVPTEHGGELQYRRLEEPYAQRIEASNLLEALERMRAREQG